MNKMNKMNKTNNLKISAFLNKNFKRDFLIENLLPANDSTDNKVAVLYGEAQVGKSQMAMQIALHTVYNVPFLFDNNFKINNTQHRPVLYLALEGGEMVTNQNLQKQLIDFVNRGYDGDEFSNIIISASNDLVLDYDVKTASFYTLEKTIKQLNPCLVIIDTISNLATLMGENLSSQRGVTSILAPFQELAQKYDFTPLFISHPTKTKKDNVYDMAGGHSLVDCSHTILKLEKAGNNKKRTNNFVNKLNLMYIKTNLLENRNPVIRIIKNNNLICDLDN